MDKENEYEIEIQKVKKIIEELLTKMCIKGNVDIIKCFDGIKFIIRTKEGGLLIGEEGKNLSSFSHLVKRISEKILREEKKFTFSLDVNDYQTKKIEDLRNLARLYAQRVRYFKKEVVLRPMTSFERRIIHLTLSDSPDIITESIGKEPNRQVVIKPYR